MGAPNLRRGTATTHQVAVSTFLLLVSILLVAVIIGSWQSTTSSKSRIDELFGNQISGNHAEASVVQGEVGAERSPRSISFETSPSAAVEGSSSLGWSQLNLGPKEIASTRFQSFRVKIFNHTGNEGPDSLKNRYFYAPISLFAYEDTACTTYPNGKSYEVVLNITMWNDKSQRTVAQYLNDLLCSKSKVTGANQCLILEENVEVIPFEEVRLVATKSAKNKFSGCTVDSAWRPYQAQQWEEFTMSCLDEEECKAMALQMRNEPQKFRNHLQVALRLTSLTKGTKTRNIRVTNLLRSKLAAAIDQQFSKKPHLKTALLTSADYKEFIWEAVTNVAIDTFDDSEDIVDDWTQENVMSILEKFLAMSTTWITQSAGESAWESVFWREENYRPDKSAATLNNIQKDLDTKQRDQLQAAFSGDYKDTSTKSRKTEAGFWKFSGSHSTNEALVKEIAERSNISVDKTRELLTKSKDYVKWDGVKFAPKEMELTGVNLANLRDAKYLSNQKVQVRNSPIVLATPIHLPSKDANDLNAEFVEQRFGAMILEERSKSSLQEELLKSVHDQLIALEDEFHNSALPTLENKLGFLEAITMQNIPQTCQDLKNMGVVKSGDYLIDPDGSGFGDAPFTAYCDMIAGVTVVKHDTMDAVVVKHCRDPGCHVTAPSYKASMKQIQALIALSNECQQNIRYDCLSAPLGDDAWWLGGASKEQNFFWDADHGSDNHTCACAGAPLANENKCLNGSYPCNCDAGAPAWHSDAGTLTNKNKLPVTELHLGGFMGHSQEAKFRLGPLRCSGKDETFVATESCATLQLAGHVSSGYYLVDSEGGKTLDLVRCNMQKDTLTDDGPSTDVRIPAVFVVSTPTRVAFSAVRDSRRLEDGRGSVIHYDRLPVNDGDAMTLAGVFTAPLGGVYLFSLHHGPKAANFGYDVDIICEPFFDIAVDGDAQMSIHGMRVKNYYPSWGYSPVSGVALLKLQAGQNVTSVLQAPSLQSRIINGPIYFTGHLMYPA